MDYQGLLGGFGPTEDDQRQARIQGLLQAGLGILAANNQRNVGPALGAGGLMGFRGYQDALQQAQQQRMAQMAQGAKIMEMQRAEEQRRALAGVFGGGNQSGFMQVGTRQPGGFNKVAASQYLSLGGDPSKLKALRELEEGDKPQLVTVAGPDGRPVQRWVRPGEDRGVDVGAQYRPDLDPAARRAKIEDRLNLERQLDPMMRGRALAGRSLNVNQNFPARQDFKDEQALRKEYMDESKSFVKLSEGYAKVKNALASDPMKSAPATLAAATQFMKMLDPDSVVRESELSMALNSTGMMDRVLNLHNQVMSGKVLTAKQVEEIGKIADVVYGAAEGGQSKRFDTYRKMSADYGFSGDRAIPDLRMPKTKSSDTMTSMPPAKEHKGRVIEDESGKRFKSDGMTWRPL